MKFYTGLKSMYGYTTILLLFLAVVASYYRQAFPTNLVIAILVAALLDISIKKFALKKEVSFPWSAIISGTIIGSIAPLTGPVIIVLIASSIAIISKYTIRLGGRHIFNPATLGLLIALAVFSLGDKWWAATAGFSFFGFFFPLTLLLVLANYKAGKLRISIPFLLTSGVLLYAPYFLNNGAPLINLITLLSSLPYYFAFIMVSEPKTSPYKQNKQIAFGITIAVLSFVLTFYSIPYGLLIALLLGNLGYALYKRVQK